MSSLTPLAFPEDNSVSNRKKSIFPYTAVSSSQHSASAQDEGTSRMQQLETMLQEAQGRAEIIEKETYEKAYLAGEKAGMALGRKRGEQILQALQETLQDAESSLACIQQSCAEAAIDVAGHIAERIVGTSMIDNASALMEIARQAAARLPDSSGLQIAVSLDDHAAFKRLLEDDSSMMALVCEASVASGTCRIISNQQDILVDPVAAVATYLEALRPDLLAAGGPVETEASNDRPEHTDEQKT